MRYLLLSVIVPKIVLHVRISKKICSIASRSFPQKEQVTSFSTPMFSNTTFVAKIRCTSLIWNHLSFISRIFLDFFKASIPVYVSVQFGLPLLTFWFISILYKHLIVKACTLLSALINFNGLYYMI